MSRLRTFIAVELDEVVRDRCAALQETLARTGAAIKWVERENLHVTLLFLGEVDERDVVSVCKVVGTTCADIDSFPLVVEGVGTFGSPRRPRTVWAGVSTGAQELVAVHAALEPPLLALGCYRREERRYTPHITLGRARGDAPDDRLGQAVLRQARWNAGEFEVAAVSILSSELTPHGPVYSLLSTAPLRHQ